MRQPCRECPFRKKSLPGYVGGHADVMEIHTIINADQKFPCHMEVTDIKDDLLNALGEDEDDALGMSDEQAFHEATQEAGHCVGALIYMNQTCKKSRDPQISRLQVEAGKSEEVFASPIDFLGHHGSKDPTFLHMKELRAANAPKKVARKKSKA